ncbi:DedA family protein [Sodalis endosymbiont of Henestaris halophilus]|uniref:DedA family protein n=1 Tax=Sodalis endosymbiont of Henestaris halophilus TaxID=1929246 RepID=UPI000BBFB3A6|nr:DedA family protein [Sodalis endosymbiont of Henestaris halophilus]SNC59034.1 Inner membrane protein YqjA [Sodalis endosymbiont of Henestaris halophilus]
MDTFKELLHSLWQQDFETLSNSNLVWAIYLLVFLILFLENGLLPTAFLPGDSLLILLGVLIAKGILNFPLVLLLLTAATSLGSWISYIQGKWLENNRVVKSWLEHLPTHYHKRAYQMFHRHWLSALLISRFIAFVRTLLPTIAGLSGLSSSRFHFFNCISAFLWVFILTLAGLIIGTTPVFNSYEEELMLCLMLLPMALLTIGLISSLVIIWRRKRFKNSTNSDEES